MSIHIFIFHPSDLSSNLNSTQDQRKPQASFCLVKCVFIEQKQLLLTYYHQGSYGWLTGFNTPSITYLFSPSRSHLCMNYSLVRV